MSGWKAHDAQVTAVSWAHPIFHPGLIVTGSADRSVRVWQEYLSSAASEGLKGKAEGGRTTSRKWEANWVESARLNDARGAVRDVAFAPVDIGTGDGESGLKAVCGRTPFFFLDSFSGVVRWGRQLAARETFER